MTKTCLYCLSEVQEAAVKCKFCGEWLHNEGENGQKVLMDFSATNPLIQRAERNAENVRFAWKAMVVACVAGIAPLISLSGNGYDLLQIVTVAAGCAMAILTIALLSSVSVIVDLLAAILRNQVTRLNRSSNGRLHTIAQMVHE